MEQNFEDGGVLISIYKTYDDFFELLNDAGE